MQSVAVAHEPRRGGEGEGPTQAAWGGAGVVPGARMEWRGSGRLGG